MKSLQRLTTILLCAIAFSSIWAATPGKVTELNQKQFQAIIGDYALGEKMVSKSKAPIVIDIFATWCGPCKRLSPILEELATEYKGKIGFYKMDIDINHDIAKSFGVNAVPTMLLIPAKGHPQIITGLYPKEELIKTFNHIFFSTTKKK